MTGRESESEFGSLVKQYTDVKHFKSEKSEEILKNFKSVPECKFKLRADEKEGISRPNLSCTAVCVDAVCQYTELWKEGKGANYKPDFCSMKKYYEFIIGTLEKYLDVKSSNTSRGREPSELYSTDEFSLVNILSVLKNIQEQADEKEENNPNQGNEKIIKKIIRMLCKEFIKNRLAYSSREKPHPFIYYKFLQIIRDWEDKIYEDIDSGEWEPKENGKEKKEELAHFVEKVKDDGREAILDYFFEKKIYNYGKYEMYRQMALYNAGDLALFDVKRLIYSLLIVKFQDKYSNNLIKDKVLRVIFEEQLDPNTGLFPIGHVVNTDFVLEGDKITEKKTRVISASPILSSVECLKDMLAHEELEEDLEEYQKKLNPTYEWLLKRLREESSEKPLGWFPEYESVHIPESWVTAHSLIFLKRYCEMLSRLIDKNTREYFQAKEARDLDKEWDKLCDSYKIKEYLGGRKEEEKGGGILDSDWHSALIFGPPGSGKSTIAKALAKRLHWNYVELTPAVFLSGGAQNIVLKATEVFNRLVRMKRTVILFDEVDELVKSREEKGGEQSVWIVTALLPEFEKLREQHEIRFILATNHVEKVDSAVRRSGRIDLVRPMGATCWRDRLRMLKEEIKGVYQGEGTVEKEIFGPIADKNIGVVDKEQIKGVPPLRNFLERTNYVPVFEMDGVIKEIFKDKKSWAKIKTDEYYKIFFTEKRAKETKEKIRKFVNPEFKDFHEKDLKKKEIVELIKLSSGKRIEEDIDDTIEDNIFS